MVGIGHVGREPQLAEEGSWSAASPLGHERRAHPRAVDVFAHPAAAHLDQQLGAETDREGREVGGRRQREQLPDTDEVGLVASSPSATGAAQRHQAVVPAEAGGELVTGAEVALVELATGVAEPLPQAGGRIALMDDDDEQAGHTVEASSPRGAARSRSRGVVDACGVCRGCCVIGRGGAG